jgi:hypothetical protein
MASAQEVKRFLKRECPDGEVEQRGHNHYMLHLPNGRKVLVGCTVSDHRGLKNAKAQIRRALRS